MANRLADMHEIAPELTEAVAKRITSTDLAPILPAASFQITQERPELGCRSCLTQAVR
jgi:hypothetical protein